MTESNKTITIVAAQPGWFVATLYNDDQLWLEPVLAWEIERSVHYYVPSGIDQAGERFTYHCVRAITLENEGPADSDCCAFKQPNGTFVMSEGRTFANEAELTAGLVQNKAAAVLAG